MRWRSAAPTLVAAVAVVGGCGGAGETYSLEPTRECLSAGGARVIWVDGPGEFDPLAGSTGTLVAYGVYEVTVHFGEDAAEAAALAERLEKHEDLDPFEGREYRFVVRRSGNAVVSARVPKDEYPTSDLGSVLDRAEHCLAEA